MQQYIKQVKYILEKGVIKTDRTGTGTKDCFGYQNRYDLSKGFPLITTKKIHLKSVIFELLWFIHGDTNIKYLNDNGVHIWDEWADKNGNLGPVYGYQWRSWPAADGRKIDQLKNTINQIKNNPDSRRHIISSWNAGEIDNMALPPCHLLFQFDVTNGKLSCQLYQRSADVFLGVPFNIASYALFTQMMAQVCGLQPGEFIHSFGSHHLYLNHIEQAKQQILRKPYPLPIMKLNPDIKNIEDFKFEDFQLTYDKKTLKNFEKNYADDPNWKKYLETKKSYVCHPHIKGEISI